MLFAIAKEIYGAIQSNAQFLTFGEIDDPTERENNPLDIDKSYFSPEVIDSLGRLAERIGNAREDDVRITKLIQRQMTIEEERTPNVHETVNLSLFILFYFVTKSLHNSSMFPFTLISMIGLDAT